MKHKHGQKHGKIMGSTVAAKNRQQSCVFYVLVAVQFSNAWVGVVVAILCRGPPIIHYQHKKRHGAPVTLVNWWRRGTPRIGKRREPYGK